MRLGRISLGEKIKRGDKEFPSQREFFDLEPLTQDQEFAQQQKQAFKQLFGDKPSSFKGECILIQIQRRWYSSAGLRCISSDGINAVSFEKETVHKTCSNCENQDKCKRYASFLFRFPTIPGIGEWELSSASSEAIARAEELKKIMEHYSLPSIPLIVSLTRKKTGRIRLNIVCPLSLSQLKSATHSTPQPAELVDDIVEDLFPTDDEVEA